jgi:hypothetical protein
VNEGDNVLYTPVSRVLLGLVSYESQCGARKPVHLGSPGRQQPAWFAPVVRRRGSDPDDLEGCRTPSIGRPALMSIIGQGRRTSTAVSELKVEVDRSYHLGRLLHAATLVADW